LSEPSIVPTAKLTVSNKRQSEPKTVKKEKKKAKKKEDQKRGEDHHGEGSTAGKQDMVAGLRQSTKGKGKMKKKRGGVGAVKEPKS
jgi:hypothetical protein